VSDRHDPPRVGVNRIEAGRDTGQRIRQGSSERGAWALVDGIDDGISLIDEMMKPRPI
jgi:hypothetical protein